MSRLHWIAAVSLGALGCGAATPPPTSPPSSPAAPLGPEWASLEALAGSWAGTGTDASHPSHGGFSLAPDLGGKVLVRRGTNDAGAEHHEDLTIIYRTPAGDLQASYFDNEGHAIHYAVTPATDGKTVAFLSDETAGAPRFRLTYVVVTPDTLSITFDIAPPGSSELKTYLKGEVHRHRPR